MRKRNRNQNISVHAVAGTHVVLLGMNASEKAVKGLLGFTVHRCEEQTEEWEPLLGDGRSFKGLESKVPAIHQVFLWSDYVVDPKTTYTYRVAPVYGDPAAPETHESVEVTITTEDPDDGTHAIFFNRSVAGSQAYSRHFDTYRKWYKKEAQEQDPVKMEFTEFLRPDLIPDHEAYKWLSRGLEEAMLGFIAQAKGPEYAIRAAVYEFTYLPVIQAFVDALERGVDVKIVHHAKPQSAYMLKGNKNANVTVNYSQGGKEPVNYKKMEVIEKVSGDSVCEAANRAVSQIGISKFEYLTAFKEMLIPRTITQISHNKFIVLLKHGKPIQVWTGSTNFTAGGIFGQSNVGHVVRDDAVAQKYYEYWCKLSTDPKKKSGKNDPPDQGIQNWTVLQHPDFVGPLPPNSITPVFSPRLTKAMLDWYADRLDAAKNSVFFTAAFSVANEIFEKVTTEKPVSPGEPYLRYLLLEGITGLMRAKYPVMASHPQNRIAWGDTLKTRVGGEEEHKQFIETLTGLNDHVNYLHTKFMMIDPLSDDPLVITGSANFSEASTVSNDENMLIIRGSTRVADIFLGEFMRLFNHFRSRNERNKLSSQEMKEAEYLVPDDSWTAQYYSEGEQKYSERLLFS
jgi:phosphatidylserine/phosphatidylglycerophosphate/cardiolipin synthase-like enzyme